MPSEAEYRSQAEALLRRAAAADNMRTRGDLIDEAARYHALAMQAGVEGDESPDPRPAEPASFREEVEDRRPTGRPRGLSALRWFLRPS